MYLKFLYIWILKYLEIADLWGHSILIKPHLVRTQKLTFSRTLIHVVLEQMLIMNKYVCWSSLNETSETCLPFLTNKSNDRNKNTHRTSCHSLGRKCRPGSGPLLWSGASVFHLYFCGQSFILHVNHSYPYDLNCWVGHKTWNQPIFVALFVDILFRWKKIGNAFFQSREI